VTPLDELQFDDRDTAVDGTDGIRERQARRAVLRLVAASGNDDAAAREEVIVEEASCRSNTLKRRLPAIIGQLLVPATARAQWRGAGNGLFAGTS
jgi:hypothetical protein